MPLDQHNSTTETSRFASTWRLIQQGYSYANIATHHTLGALLKLVVVAYFIFCALFLTLRYAVLPHIDRYKGDVEQVASRVIGRPVSIGTIYASWQGLRPYLFLGGVVIHDRNGREALNLPGVAATFSWWSIPAANVRLHSLEISRPDLDIRLDADGKLYVAGIFIDPKKEGDGKGMDWVLSQPQIVIREGRIRWNDEQRKAPELVLNDVNFLLRNHWRHHRFALTATPPEAYAAPLDIRADFVHPAFARKISDVTKWKGQLYVDLRRTDLAVWNTYVDYPFEIQRGNGAVRAWLDFNQTKVADFTADLTLSNVSMRLQKDLQPLNLAQVNGRVSVQEYFNEYANRSFSTFGEQGHTIALTNFSMRTDDGLVLPKTTISETFRPAQKGQSEKTEIKAQSLELEPLANFVERLPLPAAQRQMLVDFSPRGHLGNFTAQWQGTYPNISDYTLQGQFNGLSLKAQEARPAKPKTEKSLAQAAVPAIPGFENLTGKVDADSHGGSLTLDSQQLALDLPGYFSEPQMPFDHLQMQAGWAFQEKDQLLLNVSRLDFAQPGLAGSFSMRHVMPLAAQHRKGLGTIDLTGHLTQFEIDQIGRHLPIQTPERLREWLTGALQGGIAKDVNIRLKGDLGQFPFHNASSGGKRKGEFTVFGKIENGKLNYTPGRFAKDGKAPLWPELEDIQGTIAFDRTRMTINAQSAKTHGVTLTNIKTSIPDLLSRDATLSVEGDAEGPLQELVHYTVDSPVAEWIGNFTDETKANGNAKLNLKLQLPLAHLSDAKVQGILQFADNDVVLLSAMPPLQKTNGKLEFNERGFNLYGIKTNFLGGAATIAGGSQRDGNIVVKADGSVSVPGLKKAFPTPAMQRLAERITGSTRYSATISVKKGQPNIVVESSMQGFALDFPAPLRKTTGESMPLRFESAGLPAADSMVSRNEIKLSLGSAISARYLRQKTAGKGSSWQVVRGGIGVNTPAPQPDSGVIANINVKSLNIDEWSKTVNAIIDNGQRAATDMNTSAGPNLMQYFTPDVFAARANELYIVGKKLNNVVVGASRLKGAWQANIDSDQASGYVTWDQGQGGQAIGKVSARLASLVIPQSDANDVSDLLEGRNTSTQIPSLDIIAEDFELSGKKLGRLELVANNVLASATREWRITKLSLANPDAELKGTGKWIIKNGENLSNLNYVLDINNAGKLLDRLGFNNMVHGGKGKIEGDLSWKGLPFSFDIPSLSGQLKLDVASGQFLKVGQGAANAAKLLGVLSLQALPRRLTLDFRDVFSEGFAFDGITATADIAQGVAKTDNFKMRGVNATVLMNGSADIANETQNLHVVVIPEINAGAASVVYGLAVNPVIGVGTFLAQLFLREPLARAFTFEYQVVGPWSDPTVTKLPRNLFKPRKTPPPTENIENAG